MRTNRLSTPAGVERIAGKREELRFDVGMIALAAIHHEDKVGRGGNDRFVRERPVAGKSFDGIHAACQFDYSVGRRAAPGAQDLAVLKAENEQHPLAVGYPGGERFGRFQLRIHLFRQPCRFLLRADRLADKRDLAQDSFVLEIVRNFDVGNAGLLENVHGFLGPASLERKDRRRLHRKNPFGRERAHVAHIRQAQGGGRIDAGRITGGQQLLFAESIDDFGDRAAHRDQPRRIGNNGNTLFGTGRPGAGAQKHYADNSRAQ